MEKINYLGIDVSNLTLDICKEEGDKEVWQTIPNIGPSILEWIGTLPQNAHCVFEATGVYSHKLEYILGENQIRFSKVNPARIKGFVHANGWLNKNDRHDARYIKRFGQTLEVAPTKGVDGDQLKKDRYLNAIKNLRIELQRIDNQIHVIKQEPIDMPELLGALDAVKNSIEEQITQLEFTLKSMRKINEVNEVNEMELLQTIPGIGPKIAQAMMDAIGSFQYFENEKQVVKYFGLCPVNERSGTTVKRCLGICRTAVPQVRAKLYMGVTSAVKSNPACGALQVRLREKGSPKKLVRIAIAHKMVRQAFAIVKSGVAFDPNYQEKFIQNKHKSPRLKK